MTLLILPLMESAVDAREKVEITTLEWFQQNKDLLLTFFLSYMVVAMAWIDHDRLFRSVSHFNPILHILNFLWLMAIAFIPAATNIMNSVEDDALQHFVWIGTVLFAKVIVFCMTLVVHRNPNTWERGTSGPQFPLVVNSGVTIILLVVAMLVSMTTAGYLMLLILLLRTPLSRAILFLWPSLETKWQVNDNDVKEQTAASKIQSLVDKHDDDGDGTYSSSYRELRGALRYILEFRDRIDGLMEAERRIIFTDAGTNILSIDDYDARVCYSFLTL